MNVLVVRSSIQGQGSASNQLANELLEALNAKNITERDVASTSLPHIDGELVQAFYSEQPDEQQQDRLKLSDQLIEEVKQADHIILAAPMYNFGVASGLKAWFDHLARVGVTFRYEQTGPIGLLKNKPVTVIATRGGKYAGTELDTQTRFIKNVLGFLGLTDVHFIYAEGLGNPEAAASQMQQARTEIRSHAALFTERNVA